MSKTIQPLAILEGGLGMAGSLALLRLVLRLLAADELSPLGRVLTDLGGLVVAPFKAIFRLESVGQLPGSTFEPVALVAGVSYIGLAGLIAFGLAWRNSKSVNPPVQAAVE